MKLKQKQTKKNQSSQETFLNRKIVSPQKLKILVLAGNDLFCDQIDFLHKCISLIKLDLSHNNLTKINEKINFSHLDKLEVLFLHNNKISYPENIEPISASSSLIHLTYHHNPIEQNHTIEHQIVNMIQTLKVINNRVINVQQRSCSIFIERKNSFIDSDLYENWKSNENTEAYYLKVLNIQLQYIDNMWAFSNPIVQIQRAMKYFSGEKQSKGSRYNDFSSKNQSRKVQSRGDFFKKQVDEETRTIFRKCFDQWRRYSNGLLQVKDRLSRNRQDKNKDKSYMLLPFQHYNLALRNKKIQEPLARLLKRIRQKLYEKKMVARFKANLALKAFVFSDHVSSFYCLSGIQQNNRFYYGKHQQFLLDNFLKHISENFNKRQVIYDQSVMKMTKNYTVIRFVDADSFTIRYNANGAKMNSFCALIWPSMKMISLKKKKAVNKFRASIIGIKSLNYIQNRDKKLTQQQFEKSSQTYRYVTKFAENQYEQGLYYFECKDKFVMQQLLRMVFYHNTKILHFQNKNEKSQMLTLLENYEEPFMVYTDHLMQRNSAAVLIQKTWRRFISNKTQEKTIYQKMKTNRAVLKIQRFTRNIVFSHRYNFQKQLFHNLQWIQNPTIIYPLNLYINFHKIHDNKDCLKLFKGLKITRSKDTVGGYFQFFKNIFPQKTRNKYFGGKQIEFQKFANQIDIYNLLHFGTVVKMMKYGSTALISFTFKSKEDACLTSSLIALLSYQFWGKKYIFPITKQHLELFELRMNDYSQIKIMKGDIKLPKSKVKPPSLETFKQLKENGIFLYRKEDHFNFQQEGRFQVEFYQKKHQNYPQKYTQNLEYSFINVDIQEEIKMVDKQKSALSVAKQELGKDDRLNILKQDFSQFTKQVKKQAIKSDQNENLLTIRTIDKQRLSFYDYSMIEKHQFGGKSRTQQFSVTMEQQKKKKRDEVVKAYRKQMIKKEAIKQFKESNISNIRDKARKDKFMNMTLKNMKELERTQEVRNTVNRVRQFKSRASSNKKAQESGFILQNNFVMDQQLKMIIMKNKMKEREKKEEGFLQRKSFSHQKQDQFQALNNRKTELLRLKEEDSVTPIPHRIETPVIGEEGSVVNAAKNIRKNRKSKSHSIGAYIRDPSFVHGIFPEQYYPIENRNAIFFPPV